MADHPRFYVRPPLRCFEVLDLASGAVCGELAAVLRPTTTSQVGGYFCAQHQRAGDRAIPDVTVFRRVSITLEVLFGGTSWLASQAQAEAVARLERAVESAGGVIHLQTCRSEMGESRPSALARRAIAAGARPSGR